PVRPDSAKVGETRPGSATMLRRQVWTMTTLTTPSLARQTPGPRSKLKRQRRAERPPARRIPPLQHGDHLTRAEFRRRWANMPDLKHAELLNGMVYLAAESSAGRRIDPTIPPLENGDHLTRAEF